MEGVLDAYVCATYMYGSCQCKVFNGYGEKGDVIRKLDIYFKGVRTYLFWPVARENLILLQSLWIFTNLIPTQDILYVVYVDKVLSFYDVI